MDQKRISCKRCQTRKIKCTRTSPCRNCSTAGVICEFRSDDSKRSPVSREYVTAIEKRIAMLENFISELKSAPSSDERDVMIDEIDFINLLPSAAEYPSDGFHSVTSRYYWKHTGERSPTYHGPSSVYATGLLGTNRREELTVKSSLSTTYLEALLLLDDPIVNECLALFFRWQYPFSVTIDQETFLMEHSRRISSSDICSPALIYAICALGALMSPNPKVRGMADRYSTSAQDALAAQGFWVPHLASLQAFLCCAFYESGKGNLSKGWMYSGIALRMAQDLGLHRELNISSGEEGKACTSPVDAESWRRMFLNCYISDKMFSLFAGRQVSIHDEYLGHTSGVMAQSPDLEKWLNQQGLDYMQEAKTSSASILMLKNQTELAKIIHEIISQTSFLKLKRKYWTKRWVEITHNELNTRLCGWHNSIPGLIRWDKWASNSIPCDPSVAALHMLYHTARMSLNRPFLESIAADSKLFSDSLKACESSAEMIVAILHRFKTQHSLRNAPLVFVHGAIIAIDITLTMPQDEYLKPLVMETNLSALDAALADLSCTWALAGNARTGLRKLLNQRDIDKREEAQPNRTPFSGPDLADGGLNVSSKPNMTAHAIWTPQELDFQLGSFSTDLTNVFQLESFDGGDLCLWDQMGHADEGTAALTTMTSSPWSSIFPQSTTC